MEKNILSEEATISNFSLNKLKSSETRIHANNTKDPECVSCHLCAIEVPRRFINEHYKSDKHKINIKIADVALERIQKSLHSTIVSNIDTTESLYFCPQCLISLNPKDRQSHEKTVVHKKALTVDKFLYDFYVLYANDDGNSNTSSECEAIVNVESNNVKPSNEIDNTSLEIDKNQLMKISEKVEVKTNHSIDITNKNVVKSNPLKNDENCNSNVIKDEKTASNPIRSEVDNSSPFDRTQFCTFGLSTNHIYCNTCKVYVPNNASNITSHQKGFKHKELLRKINKN